MNSETLSKIAEIMEKPFPNVKVSPFPSRLEALATEKWTGKTIDVAKLDKPVCELLDMDENVTQGNRSELPKLSDETHAHLEKAGWPDTVVDAIGSEAEAEIYEDANIKPDVVNGKDVLVKQDIDYDQKDIYGQTNLERMKEGKAPLDKNGNPIELHHIGQNPDSPLVELTRDEHRGKGNDNILHNKTDESKIDREVFGSERAEHWKERTAQIEAQRQA
jgi:hypothetical protein